MQYQKVLHPFDLDLTFLAILRKAFEKSEQETNSKGISLDVFHYLKHNIEYLEIESYSSYCPDFKY